MGNRLRRSMLWVPADSEHKINKSLMSNADVIVLDLEDGTAQSRKEEGRIIARQALLEKDFGKKEKGVRINPISTGHGVRDIEITIQGRPELYSVPKIQSKQDVLEVCNLLSKYEKLNGIEEGSTKLSVIPIETPQGVLNMAEIAGASPRIVALHYGPLDLAAAIGAKRIVDDEGKLLDVFRTVRSMALLTAHAYGLDAIDTVYEDYRDDAGLRRECLEGYWMGFTGKVVIHPNQIDPVNETFMPTKEEIEECEKLVAAFEENERNGLGAFSYNGKMVDAPHLKRAERILELARQA